MDIKGKKVIVVGLGRSGRGAVELLLSQGARVDISDAADNELIRKEAEYLGSQGIKVELGGHTRKFVRGHQIAVVSPGVRPDAPVIGWLEQTGMQIISEIELASSLFKGEIIAVTGTNGKTTVVSLIGKILKDAGINVAVCGNIGTPFSREVLNTDQSWTAVTEVSSSQLERIKDFRPHISVFLNITEDHLDRYPDFENYLEAKSRIFINQRRDDYCLLNEADPHLKKMSSRVKAKVLYFDKAGGDFDLNQRAAMLVGTLWGIKQESIIDSLNSFKDPEHRLEYVDTVRGIKFINDSKATNVGAVKWALERVKGPIVLIAGGRNKKSDFSKLRVIVKDKVKKAVFTGEARPALRKALSGVVSFRESSTFSQAFEAACKIARPGEVILLSPACASFDQFASFEERGRFFKELVKKFKLCREQD